MYRIYVHERTRSMPFVFIKQISIHSNQIQKLHNIITIFVTNINNNRNNQNVVHFPFHLGKTYHEGRYHK